MQLFQKCRWLFVLFGITVAPESSAQVWDWTKRTVNSVFNDTVSSEQPKFVAYPTVAYAPETRWEIGASALYVYYAQRDTANRLSELNAFTFLTLESQYGLWLDHALYSDQSTWFFLGRLRYQRFPLLYYGIGPDTPDEELAQVDANSIAIRERVLRNITGGLYLGVELDYQRLTQVNFNVLSEEPLDLPTGNQGSTNAGIGVGLVYDNRHNVLNVREGFFGETGFLRYDDAWGSDFSFTHYFLDARYFYPVTKNQVLAYQLYGANMSGDVPFNQLALMGGESLMRGYYLGRYRDNTLVATQVEYRFLPFPFSRRWGAAAFLSAGGVAPSPRKINLGDWVVAGGAGVRFLIFPAKDVYTRIDVAFTEEGPGYYFFIGEAF
uniref:BamA/TamA family outer membrane protein n=1 Tax=Roseihalotalea indica TaxID=2867963 RepID=A0AA49GQ31_9BACT|nr:BamA/TamA family outer membrane protein [Tunicatimonas sp. TK19036]